LVVALTSATAPASSTPTSTALPRLRATTSMAARGLAV
jgi:hypothetical protein